jgi:hypothetical protein
MMIALFFALLSPLGPQQSAAWDGKEEAEVVWCHVSKGKDPAGNTVFNGQRPFTHEPKRFRVKPRGVVEGQLLEAGSQKECVFLVGQWRPDQDGPDGRAFFVSDVVYQPGDVLQGPLGP